MRYSHGKLGRVFVLRLEDGDRLLGALEDFAHEHGISHAMCILVGGVDTGGNIVVGPENGDSIPPTPMLFQLQGVHEILGVGTIFPNHDGKPTLHMHAGLGREGVARVRCIRPGVGVWKLGEVIILEITESSAHRMLDPTTGFDMLEP